MKNSWEDKKCSECGKYTQVMWAGEQPPMCVCDDETLKRLERVEEKLDELLKTYAK